MKEQAATWNQNILPATDEIIWGLVELVKKQEVHSDKISGTFSSLKILTFITNKQIKQFLHFPFSFFFNFSFLN